MAILLLNHVFFLHDQLDLPNHKIVKNTVYAHGLCKIKQLVADEICVLRLLIVYCVNISIRVFVHMRNFKRCMRKKMIAYAV